MWCWKTKDQHKKNLENKQGKVYQHSFVFFYHLYSIKCLLGYSHPSLCRPVSLTLGKNFEAARKLRELWKFCEIRASTPSRRVWGYRVRFSRVDNKKPHLFLNPSSFARRIEEKVRLLIVQAVSTSSIMHGSIWPATIHPGQSPGQVQLFGPRVGELFEAVLSRGKVMGQIKNNFSLIAKYVLFLARFVWSCGTQHHVF